MTGGFRERPATGNFGDEGAGPRGALADRADAMGVPVGSASVAWLSIRASKMMLEKHLKFWLNNAYHGQLKFIEPALGSSVGMPDCEIPFGKGVMAVETKIGTLTRSGFLHITMRPSQYRYHILEAERGCPTAVLVAVGGSTAFDAFAFAGRHLENDRYKDNVHLVAIRQRWTDIFDRERIEEVWRSIVWGYEHDTVPNCIL